MADQLPASPEVEAAVIGAAALGDLGEYVTPIRRMLSPECFSRPLWADCWRAITAIWDIGHPPDPVTVAHIVWQSGHHHGHQTEGEMLAAILEPVTREGAEYWTLPTHAKLLAQLRLRRDLIALSVDTAQAAYRDPDAEGVLAYTEAVLDSLDRHRADEEDGGVAALMDEMASGDAAPVTYSTGLPCWDAWLSGGFRPGETHVIGGPTGAGKTWVGVQVAATMALADHPVVVASLEMPVRSMLTRIASVLVGRVAYEAARGHTLTEVEAAEYQRATDSLRRSPLRIYRQQRSVRQIRAVVEQHQPALVVIDYVQLVDWPESAKSHYDAMTRITTELQALAARSDCVILSLTQMSRQAIRAGRGPVIGGMDSGRIDQVADSWLYVERDEERGCFALEARKIRDGELPSEKVYYRLHPTRGGLVPL